MLHNLTLTQFRNFSFKAFELKGKLVAITGNNGIGKTNILDAIYYLCFTKSHFFNKEAHNVQFDTNGFRVEGNFCINGLPSTVCCVYKEGKKSVSLDKVPYDKISEHIGKYNAIMIAPDDTGIITGGSEGRRKFFDSLLSIEDPAYLKALMQYNKILLQKNAYLKNNTANITDHQLLDIYDQQLAPYAKYILSQRHALTARIPDLVQAYYSQLCNSSETAAIVYKNCCKPDAYELNLQQSRAKDMEYRRSTFGPHTEDWDFLVKNVALKHHASQGQKKSFLISLKLAQLKLLQNRGLAIYLLLDDIFEKLDANRLYYFFDALTGFDIEQIFITHTNGVDIHTIQHPLLKGMMHIEL